MTLPKFMGSLCKRGHEAAAKFLQQGMKPFALTLRSELACPASLCAANQQLCPPRGWLRFRGVQSGPAVGRSADPSGLEGG